MSIKKQALIMGLSTFIVACGFSAILVGAAWNNTSDEQVAESNLILEERSEKMKEFNVQYQNDMNIVQDFLTDEQREQLNKIVERMSIAFSDKHFEELKIQYRNIINEATIARRTYEEEQARIAEEERISAESAFIVSNYNYSYSAPVSNSKEWIAQRESGGNYDAQNGRYWGRYQLSSDWFNGYDKNYILNTEEGHAIQEQKIEEYVENRYGNWDNAYSFWQGHGWY